jgi:quinol monooxygenase YgiN
MIRHVIFWALHDAADAPRFKALLDGCKGLVPGMLEFEVGIRQDGFEANVDVVLVSTFADAQALQAYQQHPRHKAVSAQLGPLRAARHVLDFHTEESDS